MTTIEAIKAWPDGAPVDAVTGKVTGVFEYKTTTTKYGDKTIQNAVLQDAGGNKIKLSVWEHPDLTPLKDKDVVLHSTVGKGGKLGGVSVKHGSYVKDGQTVNTVDLSVGKAGQFQHVAVFNQNNPASAHEPPPAAVRSDFVARPSPATQPAHQTSINGAKVGMAINCATEFMVQAGEQFNPARIKEIATAIILISNELESGRFEAEKPAQEAPKPAAKESPKAKPEDEEIPF